MTNEIQLLLVQWNSIVKKKVFEVERVVWSEYDGTQWQKRCLPSFFFCSFVFTCRYITNNDLDFIIVSFMKFSVDIWHESSIRSLSNGLILRMRLHLLSWIIDLSQNNEFHYTFPYKTQNDKNWHQHPLQRWSLSWN